MKKDQTTSSNRLSAITIWGSYARRIKSVIVKNREILLIAALAFLIRLLFISNPNLGTGDTGANDVATQAFLAGKSVYEIPGLSESIPPFSVHLLSLWRLVGDALGYDFTQFWKVLSSLFDSCLVILIYKLGIRVLRSKPKAYLAAVLYAFNPVSIVISSVHGQIEPIWLFFTLLSYYLLLGKKPRPLLSALVFGIGVSIKLVPLLLLPFIVLCLPRWRDRIQYGLVVLLMILVLAAPELYTSFGALSKQVLLYSGSPGIWGVSRLVSFAASHTWLSQRMALELNAIFKYSMLTLILVYWLFCLKERHIDFLKSACVVLLIFLVLTPGFGNQYLIWLVPFIVLLDTKFQKYYLLFGSFAMLTSYDVGIKPISLVAGYLNTVLSPIIGTVSDVALLLLWGVCTVYAVNRLVQWRD